MPQNYFRPAPWHCRWDTARSLLNRALGHDYPGTLAVRRETFHRVGGYDGDVLFENLELIRTVRAAGGTIRYLRSPLVRRLPPDTRTFLSQRVRQAYDSLAQPWRLAVELAIVPAAVVALRRGSFGRCVAAAVLVAEAGRRRAGGAAVFPADSALWTPLWLAERGVCSWLTVASRLLCQGRGGARRLRSRSTPLRPRGRRETTDHLTFARSLDVAGPGIGTRTTAEEVDMTEDQHSRATAERHPGPEEQEGQEQQHPGSGEAMDPAPDHGEDSYRGSGRLEGRRAVITGGDSGIGRAVAIAFAREGADLVLSYLKEEQDDAERTAELVRQAGRRVVLVPGDVRNERHCAQIIDTAVSELGGIDVLVNNAAYQMAQEEGLLAISTEQFDRVLKTNLYARPRGHGRASPSPAAGSPPSPWRTSPRRAAASRAAVSSGGSGRSRLPGTACPAAPSLFGFFGTDAPW